jgi:endoglucanase
MTKVFPLKQAFVAFSLLLLSYVAAAQSGPQSLAWKRWNHLQHGVAVSGWFSESGHYSMQDLRSYTTPADIDHIHQLGFDHVRIPVDPIIFECNGDWTSCDRIVFLDQVIQKALAVGLDVILDFHPNPQYTHQLLVSPDAQAKYLRLWAQIAEHYGQIDSDRIVLEVMNEFSIPDANSWIGLLLRSLDTIRRHSPNSTIIVAGAGFSDIWDLVELPSLPDSNLIYNFHYYEPHIFTHQGATWGSDYWLDIHGLGFPATAENVADAMSHTGSQEARWRLLQYEEEHWNADHVASDIAFAAQWAHERKVPLICDEFGAYRNFSRPDDRERWLTAARTAFENNHIGWTMWDYQGGFGVVYKENGTVRDDDVVLRALGLKR